MAVIGKINELDWILDSLRLENLNEYFHSIMTQGSVYRRIEALALDCSDRIEKTYPLGNGIRAIEQAYYLKPYKEAFFESHRKFVDFQLVIKGYEYFCIGDRSAFSIEIPYNESKDLIVYEFQRQISQNPQTSQIYLGAMDLAIFMPEDIHAGGLIYQNTNEKLIVKKTVIKVPVGLIKI